MASTAAATVVSVSLYVRDRHAYLARGVLGDLCGFAVPVALRRRRMRHEAAVCLVAIAAVLAARPRWPVERPPAFWWVSFDAGLASYLWLRRRRLLRQPLETRLCVQRSGG